MRHRLVRLLSVASSLVFLVGCGTPLDLSGPQRGAYRAHTYGSTSPLSLLVMPDMGLTPVLDAIQGAKSSIVVEMYMFTDYNITAQLVQALTDKAKAGVDVRVLIEPHPYVGSSPQPGPGVNDATVQALTAGGVKVKNSDPRFTYTHEKAMVIDGTTAYIMTFNWTNSAFTHNREYGVVDTVPADVAEVSRVFEADWNQQPYAPVDPSLVISPDNSRAKLLALIDSAQKSITLQSEVMGDQEIADHLGARAKAGVTIKVMLSNMATNPNSGQSVNAQEQKLLASEGITQVEFMTSLVMHAKSMLVDGTRAFVGSENLTTNSLNNNREMGIIFQDPGMVSALSAVLSKDWTNH